MPSAEIYDLSIRIFPDGFSFAVSESGKALARSQRKGLDRRDVIPFLQQDMQQLQIAETGNWEKRIIVHTPVFTLVPAALYRKEDAQVWLRFFQTDIKEYNILREDSLPVFDCVNVYALSSAVSDFVRSCGEIEVRHCLSNLLLENVVPFRQQSQSAVFLYVAPAEINVVALVSGRLMLANSFCYTTPTDVLYHLLNVYERLQLPVNETKCYVDIPENGRGMKDLLQQYIDVEII